MKLNSPWFELVREGKKIYEGRRKMPYITKYKIGDIITFSHNTNTNTNIEPFNVVIEDILEYATFEDALNVLPLYEVLPIDNITIAYGIEIYPLTDQDFKKSLSSVMQIAVKT
jgi:ASC-1-like (ASCH) protein